MGGFPVSLGYKMYTFIILIRIRGIDYSISVARSNAIAALCLRSGLRWSAFVPYSADNQNASGMGWLVSKLTGEGVFIEVRPQRMHEFKASNEQMTAV